jgi:ABC-type lipoprotein export system ATPase subunit
MNKLLDVEKLSYSYDNINNVLNDVDLTIYKNQIISLYGPSGSGKSTLLFIIGNLIKNYTGSVKSYFNNDFDKIGFIFQNFNLLKELTVFENCKVAQNIRGLENKNEIIEFSEMMGIKDLLDRYPSQLSTGQMQRAAILRAVVGGTELILCDEPTAALDSENKENIMQLMQKLSSNRTFFIASHDEIIKKYSETSYYIVDGKIKGMENDNN